MHLIKFTRQKLHITLKILLNHYQKYELRYITNLTDKMIYRSMN